MLLMSWSGFEPPYLVNKKNNKIIIFFKTVDRDRRNCLCASNWRRRRRRQSWHLRVQFGGTGARPHVTSDLFRPLHRKRQRYPFGHGTTVKR